MYGPEFLVYIPSLRRFATYFMSSKTSRRQAPELNALKGRGATLKCKLIETPKYSWHGPVVTVCNTQLSNLPSSEDVEEQLGRFNNPDESSVEFNPTKIEEDAERAEAARAR